MLLNAEYMWYRIWHLLLLAHIIYASILIFECLPPPWSVYLFSLQLKKL